MAILSYANLSLDNVKVSINPMTISLGEMATLKISLINVDEKPQIIIPNYSGLYITGPSYQESSQITIINSHMQSTKTKIYIYQIMPEKTGTFILDNIKVIGKNNTIVLPPIKFSVISGKSNTKDIFVMCEVNKKEIFEYEPIKVTYKIYFTKDIQSYSLQLPILEKGDLFSIKIDREFLKNYSQDELQESITGKAYSFAVTTENYNGITYSVRILPLIVIPKKTGKLEIPPIFFKAEVIAGYKYVQDFFGFRQRVPKYKAYRVFSKSYFVKVKPLPPSPYKYAGKGVGKFSIKIEAQPTTVKVGDPIKLKIIITGKGNFDSVEKPLISKMPEFKDFIVDENLAPGDIKGNSIIFEQTIRPKNEKIKKIPPIKFCYFDMEKKKYVLTSSNSIKINVLPTQILNVNKILPSEKKQNIQIFTNSPSENTIEIYPFYFGDKLKIDMNIPLKVIILSFITLPILYLTIVLLFYSLKKLKKEKLPEEKELIELKNSLLKNYQNEEWERKLYSFFQKYSKIMYRKTVFDENEFIKALNLDKNKWKNLFIKLNEANFAGLKLSENDKKEFLKLIRRLNI